jgi:WD40 repeat protein
MPTKIMLSSSILLLLVVSLAQPGAGSGMKPAATVPLPCESQNQLISPAGDQVAVSCSDHTVRLVDAGSGKTEHTFGPQPRITAYDYSHDGRWFAVGLWDGTVEVVSTSGAAEDKRWKSDTHRIHDLKFLPDSSEIVVGPLDRPGQIWDLRGTPKQLATLHSDFAGLIHCSFSPDGKLLVTADGDTVIRFYDAATWKMLHEYRGLTLETFAVAFTTDGKRVLIGGPDDRISVLDPATGAELEKLPKEADVVWRILPFGNDGQARIFYFDGDGKRPDHESIWNVNTAKSVPLSAERPFTGSGIVGGKLWLSSANGKVLDIWVYE